MSRHKVLLLIAFWLVFVAWYIVTPISFDERVFFASARFADTQYGGGLQGVIMAWDQKPVGNRLIIYYMYKLASLFSSFNDKPHFELAVKAIWAVHILLLCYVTWFYLKNKFLSYFPHVPQIVSYFLITSPFLLSAHTNQFNPEENGLLLSFLSLALIVSGNRILIVVSGFVLGFIVLLKGTTVFYVFQIALIIYLYYKPRIKDLRISMFVALFSCVLALSYIARFYWFAIEDVYYAKVFLRLDIYHLDITMLVTTAVRFFHTASDNILYLPGVSSFVMLTVFFYAQKKYRRLFYLLLMWILGIVPILAQDMYHGYHYLHIIIPSIYSIFELLQFNRVIYIKHANFIKNSFVLLIGLLFVYRYSIRVFSYLTFLVVLFIIIYQPRSSTLKITPHKNKRFLMGVTTFSLIMFMIGYSFFSLLLPKAYTLAIEPWFWGWPVSEAFYTRSVMINQAANVQQYITQKNQSVLYLTNGAFQYYLGLRPYTRYFYLLPLQRAATLNPSLETLPLYKRLLNEVMSYDGDYIIRSSWFPLEKYPMLQKKIEENYNSIEFNADNIIEDNNLVLYIKKR